MKRKSIQILIILLICSCGSIKYEDDKGFLNAAQAGVLEYMVKINGVDCKDSEDKPGFCALRVADNTPVKFFHGPRPYTYKFVLKCTKALNSNFSKDIEAGKTFEFDIPFERFLYVNSFTCQGEIHPEDRYPQEISYGWRLTTMVFDHEYMPREQIYPTGDDKFLILGRHALYSEVCDDNGCRQLKEKTKTPIKGKATAVTESYKARFNYFGR